MRTAVAAACLALVVVGAAAAADDGSATYTVSQRTYYFTLFNNGTTIWQYFVLVGPAGASFVGGTTGIENSARCVPGQPDGIASEIECGPLTTAVSAHLGFVATLAAPVACGAPFQFEVSSNGAASFTRVGDATLTGSCTAASAGTAHAARRPRNPDRGPHVDRDAGDLERNAGASRISGSVARGPAVRTDQGRDQALTEAHATRRRHTVRIVAPATFDSARVESASSRIAVRA